MSARLLGGTRFGRGSRRRISVLLFLGLILAFALGSASTAGAVLSDDDIPGIPRVSPFTDTLDADYDYYDVIPVNLTVGQTLTVNLTGAAGTEFDLELYAPGETTVDDWGVVEATFDDGSSDSFYYDVEAAPSGEGSGTYYLAVCAWYGGGNYTVTWSIAPTPEPDPDDEIPGVLTTTTPISGSFDGMRDMIDIFKIYMAQDEEISITVTGDADTYCEPVLWGPDATSWQEDWPVAFTDDEDYPLTLRYVAEDAGYYYMGVYCAWEPANYTLNWELRDPDGDIPDATLAYPPVAGSLEATEDVHDVYKVYLSADQTITASLDSTNTLSDFQLSLFAPSATSVTSDSAVASSTTPFYPDEIIYTASTTGWHYLDVSTAADRGSGPYSLTWASDFDTPTISVDATASYYDYASIPVTADDTGGAGLQKIEYSISGNGTSWGTSQSVDCEGLDHKVWNFSKGAVGHWYVRWVAIDGQGNVSDVVQKDFTITDDTVITVSRSVAYPAYNQYITLTAIFKRAGQNTPIAGKTVYFRRWTGTTWAYVGSGVTNSSGIATKVTLPFANAKTTYKASFYGEGGYMPSTSAVSAVVLPKAYLTTPLAPSSVYKNAAFTVSGSLKPYHAAGTYPVRIYKYRYLSGKLVYAGYVNARSYRVGAYPYYTKYVATVRLPYAGTWKLKAYHADAGHYQTVTGYRSVLVK